VTLVTLLGGARSGKSRLAVELAAATGAPVTFLATGEPRDDEMAARIDAHRAARPGVWVTVEEPLELEAAVASLPADHVTIVDCLSLWVANVLERGDAEAQIVAGAESAAAAAAARDALVVAVSNEAGLGIVPATPLGRAYRDLLGTVNRTFVEASAEAAFVVAGRPLPLADAAGFTARVVGATGG
jgi:adenosyl cobinamide kinase/adenosyl cobinamide phosphate guanylyltransferase